ncbi:MAG: hypothetical protein K8I02_12435, partial [Candidatus Methylomirabilis sp.]|nr:hypothetical protein [Deltaproteobacteria bacterium]
NLLFPADNRFVYYEDRTNTLILRPKLPMEPNAVYGVYLTRGLRDAEGKALRSPFNPAIALFTQFADLNQGLPTLAGHGVRPADLAFAWSFTTMDVFRPMDLARDGLDGSGPLGYLPSAFPQTFEAFDPAQENGSILLPPSQIQLVAALIGPVLAGSLDLASGGPFFDVIFQEFSLTDIAYVIGGAYRSPYFIGRTGLFENPVVDGRVRLDPADPRDSDSVPFFIMVPTTRPRPAPCFSEPPFPVLNFIHANQTDRIIALGIAQEAAACGIAVIGIDQPAHGPLFPLPREQLIRLIATQGGDSETAQLIVDLLPEIIALVNVMGLSDFPVDEPPPPELTIFEFITEVLDRAELIRDLEQQELIDALTEVPIIDFIFRRGRATFDADNDGLVENGEAFFTADLGKTRDMIRQTMVDLMQLNRLLKGLCVDRDGDGLDAL